MAINANDLAKLFQSLVGKAAYPQSGSGSVNYDQIAAGSDVDCSGIFVACMKKLGGTIYHGSNTIWRKYLTERGTILNTTSSNGYKASHATDSPLNSQQLQVGMAVFKWNPNTPSKFGDGLGDYQHIGLVTSVNPLRIVHSTSEGHKGVVVQKTIGTFCAWGKIKGVSYGDNGQNESEERTETTMTGGKLRTNANMRLRAGTGVNTKQVGSVPKGTTVAFTGDFKSGWVKVTYDGAEGYMCVTSSGYATLISETTEAQQVTMDEAVTTNILERIEKIEKELEVLKAVIEEMGID